ncbi:MAG: agmatinase [Dehalococcoidia bacterium]|nr:agmatinase [Dehalococcoidia bacterium]
MNSDLFFPHRHFGGIPSPYEELEKSRIVVLPVPYDATSDWHSGAREGPQAIINASQVLEFYDHELDIETFTAGIHTLPELQPDMSGPEQMVRRVEEAVGGILKQHKLPVMLGGEHSITVGSVRACLKRFPKLSVLYLDAHGDLRDSYLGTKFNHACVARRLWELCPVTQVGVRAISLEERDFLKEQGKQPFYASGQEWDKKFIQQIVSLLNRDVYITIDLDVFDPSIMSAVGNPVPGGIGWYPMLDLLRSVAKEHRIVGFDVVELNPREGPQACAFMAAQLTYKLMGYAVGLKAILSPPGGEI